MGPTQPLNNCVATYGNRLVEDLIKKIEIGLKRNAVHVFRRSSMYYVVTELLVDPFPLGAVRHRF